MTRFKPALPIALALVLAVFSTSKAEAALLTGTLGFALNDTTLSGGACGVNDFYTNCTTLNSTGGNFTTNTGTVDFTDVVIGAPIATTPFGYNPPTPSGFPGSPFLTFNDPSAGTVQFFVTAFTLQTLDQGGILILSVNGNGFFSNGADLTNGQFSFSSTRTADQDTVSYASSGTIQALGVPRDVPVPEPASMLLLGTGLVGLGARLRRRSKKA